MYKKTILLFVFVCGINKLFSLNQLLEKSDSIKNIELPASIIVSKKQLNSKSFREQSGNIADKKTIKRLNQAQDLPFLLNSMSSVVTSSDAGMNIGYSSIRIRGADLTRINVTLNGVPMNDAESQTTYFVNTPDLLSSAHSIEMSKGVGASKNGTGNFGAGIGIQNLDVQNKEPFLSYETGYGSFNTFKNTLKLSTGLLQEKWIATIRLSDLKSDGYIQNSASKLRALQFTTKYIISESAQFILNYMKGKEKTGQAWNGVLEDSLKTNRTYNELGLMSNGKYYANQTDNYSQDFFQLFFDKKITKKWSLGSVLFLTKGRGFYEEYKIGEKYKNYYLPNFQFTPDSSITQTDLIRQLWLKNNFYGGRIYALYFGRKIDGGMYLNLNQYQGKHFGEVIWGQQGIPPNYRWYDLWAKKSDINIYSMIDYKPTQNISLLADLQLREVNYQINGFRKNPSIQHNLNYHFFNPKIKLTYRNYNTIASLLMGIAQKEPNRDDIEAGIKSLPKPEKLFDIEFSYLRKIKNKLILQSNLFGMFYKDQLVLTGKINDVGAYTRSNINKSYRMGIELELRYQTINGIFEMSGNLALSQNKIIGFTEYIDNYDSGIQIENKYQKTDISFSPNIIAGGRFTIFPLKQFKLSSIQKLSFDFLPKYVGKQFLDNTSNSQRVISPYFVSDFVTQIPLQFSNKTFTIKGGIYNLFNTMYSSNGYTYSYVYNSQLNTQNYYFPQSGIRWMLGLGVDL